MPTILYPDAQNLAFSDSEAGVMNYYSTYTEGEQTNYPYSETFYEASPLNRIIKQSAPGDVWAGDPQGNSDHTVKFDYSANAIGEVRLFKVVSSPDGADLQPRWRGFAIRAHNIKPRWRGHVKTHNATIARTCSPCPQTNPIARICNPDSADLQSVPTILNPDGADMSKLTIPIARTCSPCPQTNK